MSKETQQTKGGRKVAGKITLDMAREALRELGCKVDKDASAETLTEAIEREELRIKAALQEKLAANSEQQRLDNELLIELQESGSKGMKMRLLFHALKIMTATHRPVTIYLITEKGENKWLVTRGGLSVKLPYDAMSLEALKPLIPKAKKALDLPYTDDVKGLAIALGKKPRRVEVKGGLLSTSKQPNGLYYDTPAGSYIFPFHVCNGEILDPRLYTVLALILSRFHDLNKRLIERPAKHRQKTESGDLKRTIEVSWADLSKYLPFRDSKQGQARARVVVRNAAIMLIHMKVGRGAEDGSYQVTSMFEETESNCGKKKLIAILTESFAVKLAREGKWLKFYGDVLKLPPERAAAFLFASANPLPPDGSRWRTSNLSEIVQCLGMNEGDKVHNSFYEDVVQKVHGFIKAVEAAGLAHCRIMRREGKSIVELTKKQAEFIEGREKCDVRHNWNDLAGLVLQVELLDPLDADERSIEEDDQRAIEARMKKRKEEASA